MRPGIIDLRTIVVMAICLSLFSCREAEIVEGISERIIEPNELTFSAPAPLGNQRHLSVRIRSVGNAPVVIDSLTLSENDDVPEFSLESVDDWHTKLSPIPAGEFRIVRVNWVAQDARVDTGQITVRHRDGITVIPIRTPLLEPKLVVSSEPPLKRNGNRLALHFGSVPDGDVGQIKLTLTNHHIPPLKISSICILNQHGTCLTGTSSDNPPLLLCEGHDAGSKPCRVIASTLELLQGDSYQMSLRFKPHPEMNSSIQERLRIESNDGSMRDLLIDVRGTLCVRQLVGDVCGNCGNSVVDLGEECDDGNVNQTDACRNTCQTNRCGDGRPGPDEECDDGNDTNGDGCDNNCTITGCGNGIRTDPEICDDGNTDDTDDCLSDCQRPFCGDGFVQSGETCDDGNDDNGDECTNECREARCGDGYVQLDIEKCDDGNDSNDDDCLTTCVLPQCGDGHIQVGVEMCDDGNTMANDACTNQCRTARCGDGLIHVSVEQCDDGNRDETDGCRNDCTRSRCGDGVVYAGVELCDDGNQNEKDGCLNDCTPARCGDGILHVGVEECDDGNQDNGDICRNDCTLSRCGDGIHQAHAEECDHGELNGRDGRCSAECTRIFDCLVSGIRVLSNDAELPVPRASVCEPDALLANTGDAAGLFRLAHDIPLAFRAGPDGDGVLFGAPLMERLLRENGPDGHKASSCIVVDLGAIVRTKAIDTQVSFSGSVCDEGCGEDGCGEGHLYGVIGAGRDRDFYWLGVSDQTGHIRHELSTLSPIEYLGVCRLGFPATYDHLLSSYIGAYGTPTGPIDGAHLVCN